MTLTLPADWNLYFPVEKTCYVVSCINLFMAVFIQTIAFKLLRALAQVSWCCQKHSFFKQFSAGFSWRSALRDSHEARQADEMALLLLLSCFDNEQSLRSDGRFRSVWLHHNACSLFFHHNCVLELGFPADVFWGWA